MAISSSGFSVARSTGVCFVTGAAFAPGERCVAALVERDEGVPLERIDYSLSGWDNRGFAPLAGGARYFGVWRFAYTPTITAKKALLSDDELLDLFEQLGSATQEKQIAFRYVLTLLLVRKRLLRMMGTKPRMQDRPALMLVVPKGSTAEVAPTEVVDPGLTDAAVAEVIEQVGQLISGSSEEVGTA
jgi:hypothetical protein